MRESQFNTEMVQSLRYWGAFAYKLADLPASLTRALRFTPDKPCDIIAGFAGKMVGIESKQMKKYEAFGLRHIRDSQVEHMNAMIAAGCRAFVILNIRIRAVKGETKHENRTVIFDWKEFREQKESIKAKDLKSLPYITYQTVKIGNPADKNTQLIYNLKPFLESL